MKNKVKFSLRIGDETFKKISYLANFEGRSTNRQIEFALKRYIRDFERLNGTIPTENAETKSQEDKN